MSAAELVGRPVPGRCVVPSRPRPAYRAVLPLSLLAGVYGGLAVWDEFPFGWYAAAGFLLVGVLRAAFWYRCGDDSVWDDGEHLIWARRGEAVTVVAWADVRDVMLETSLLPPEWTWGDRGRGTSLPGIFVRSATPSAIQHPLGPTFATLVLLRRRDVEAASRALAEVCERHGVGFVWWDGGRQVASDPEV